ncbi:late competence development ComFB family protein [Pseudobacteroides cellulosolvens]|uniref:Late competence development protein ComFB n=1 Tax=Pseudobacteroides cellulosolvens ATCC 35603 = DSM 2933 TaxID=398512 RepID=A0A0L6JU88_9FIRM|nr:late competence development ComFB family protein [Pseudobacteroides cellulosolvens]KNY29421.1 Late competence development protein ComFB [Pseudobacteroides cellulosolvens ATCC 35603 = DSM 2933]
MKTVMKNFKDNLYTYAGLENLTENIVLQELYYFVENTQNTRGKGFCDCWICLADVAAIILNDIKPNYCSNFIDKDENSEYFTKLRTEVHERIIKAFEMVKKNPHHEARE